MSEQNVPSIPARVLSFVRSNLLTIGLLAVFLGILIYQRVPLYLENRKRINLPAPEIRLKTLAGKEYKLSAEKGKFVVLNFWATWCLPCRLEIGSLKSLYGELQGPKFEMYAVTHENPETVRNFLKSNPVNYPVLIDSIGQAHRDYRIRVFPTFVHVGPDGRITDISSGMDFFLKWKLRYRVQGRIF